MRTLILSHGHPAFSIGGAEVASYNLHRGLNQLPGCESHYLARVGPPVAAHRDTPFMSLRQGERERTERGVARDHAGIVPPAPAVGVTRAPPCGPSARPGARA